MHFVVRRNDVNLIRAFHVHLTIPSDRQLVLEKFRFRPRGKFHIAPTGTFTRVRYERRVRDSSIVCKIIAKQSHTAVFPNAVQDNHSLPCTASLDAAIASRRVSNCSGLIRSDGNVDFCDRLTNAPYVACSRVPRQRRFT